MSISPGSGWYTDPNNPRNERYFDGRVWTEHVRADVPDIPLAPWVDPQSVPSINGHAVDTSAPTNNSATWLSLGLAAVGVAAAFTTGVMQTNAAIAEAGEQIPGIRVVDPPDGGSGTPLLPLASCQDMAADMVRFDEENQLLNLTGRFGELTVTVDNQPIYTLPEDASEQYRILECRLEAERADGSVRPARGLYVVDFQGRILIDYGDA